MYYDINKILVSDNYNGQKWFSGVNCDLTPKKDFAIVFDIILKIWKYQSLSNWNSYLVEIGNLKLAPTQKLDAKGNVINKTHEELYLEGLITKDEYVKIQTQIINSEFERQCSKVGVDFEGNKFQYDDTSRSRLLEVKDDARVGFWRNVDNENVYMDNIKKNSLYSTLVLAFYTKFAEKSQQIDTIGT